MIWAQFWTHDVLRVKFRHIAAVAQDKLRFVQVELKSLSHSSGCLLIAHVTIPEKRNEVCEVTLSSYVYRYKHAVMGMNALLRY